MPHGNVELHWQENALLITAHGPFNYDGITRAFEQIKSAVAKIDYVPWVRVDILDNETLGCPEVMKVIGDSYKWACQNNCYEVVVFCSNRLQETMLNEFTSYTKLNIRAFTDRNLALSYVDKIAKVLKQN